MRLYHYWRSSSSWRVRWAFAHKSIACEFVAVDILKEETDAPTHLARNPLGFVPVLEIGGAFLAESMAIMEWAEETTPKPTLLPGDALNRARVRQLAEMINADTQPLQNLNPQQLHSSDPAKQKEWARHWMLRGLGAYEKIASRTAGVFSVGDELSLADLCLIPQCYNALRYDIALEDFPTVARVHAAAMKTESCEASHPDRFKPV